MKVLEAIRKEVREIGAKYVMVIHPDQFQVESELRQEVAQRFGLDLGGYDFSLPQRFFRNQCISLGVMCLDMLPTFRMHGSGGGLYLARDTHYNRKGNRLAAQLIFKFLRDFHLIHKDHKNLSGHAA